MNWKTLAPLLCALLLLCACGDDGDDSGNNGFVDNNGTNNGENNGTNNGQNNGEVPMGPFDSFAERPCPPDSVLTHDNFGGPFMLNWCTGCHSSALEGPDRAGATVGIDFDTIEGIRDHSERIWARSGDQNATMPPAGGPPEMDRALLGEWLACGAPD